jgi:dephospho-CoA kinase
MKDDHFKPFLTQITEPEIRSEMKKHSVELTTSGFTFCIYFLT